MSRLLEKLKGYKTAIVNGIVTLTGIAVSFGALGPEIGEAVTANVEVFYGALLSLIGVVNIFLRTITDTKIGSSE